jgi:hypothetical protein
MAAMCIKAMHTIAVRDEGERDSLASLFRRSCEVVLVGCCRDLEGLGSSMSGVCIGAFWCGYWGRDN